MDRKHLETEVEDWHTLSPQQQAHLMESLEQIERGQTTPYEKVMADLMKTLRESKARKQGRNNLKY